MESIDSLEKLEGIIKPTEKERNWFKSPSSLPFLVSAHFAKLIEDDPDDPIRREVVPQDDENNVKASLDPLGEVSHSVTERLVHRYHDRAALLVTDRCFTYCRHCFRRRFTGTATGPISKAQLDDAIDYLKKHEEIIELLLTGGDMFTLSDESLEDLLGSLKEARPDILLRLCTRAVVTMPSRFTDDLIKMIKKYDYGSPFVLMTQFNHPREVTEESIAAVGKFVMNGIPAFNQSVLLKGVNDDADTLETLCNLLLKNRIKPYYLFQADLVGGTEHLRVGLEKGLGIEEELRKRLSGLAMPEYTLDLPESGGKVILTKQHYMGHDKHYAYFTTPEGEKRKYPLI